VMIPVKRTICRLWRYVPILRVILAYDRDSQISNQRNYNKNTGLS
jgi:hypothetical protein